MKKLKLSILTIFTLLGLLTAGLVTPTTVGAVDLFKDVCKGGGSGSTACQGKEETISGNNGIVLKAANLVAIIAGIAGVIMVMVGAFMYITAGGDSGKISSGKNTVIYALVGLVIIALARTIVGYVIDKVL